MPSLWRLFKDVVCPAVGPLVRMERRGMRVDEGRREEMHKQAQAAKDEAMQRILEVASGFHEARRGRLEAEIERLWGVAGECCAAHLGESTTRRRRAKCVGCTAAVPTLTSIRKAKDILKRIGDGFRLASDDDWRVLLFGKAPVGLGLKPLPGTLTPKQKLPKVDADTIEKMQRKYPDQPILRAKVEADAAEYRLSVTLAVPVDAEGFAHTTFMIPKTRTGRLASGTDDQEESKRRESEAGNQQNIADEDRSIYVGDRECDMIGHGDLKNVEALVVAWLAGEDEMIAKILGNGDIHAENGMLLARTIGFKLDPADVDKVAFPHDPKRKSFRQNGKLTHKWHYGLSARGMEKQYGIPAGVCQRLMDAYFERWSKVRKWQVETERMALELGHMTTPFGRRFTYPRQKDHKGVLSIDREQALADGPQSIVGDMIKVIVAEADRLTETVWHGRMMTTTHDSITLNVCSGVWDEKGPATLTPFKRVMERKWEQMGERPGFGMFWCPSDWMVGWNWGKANAGNETGLRKMGVPG